MSEPQDRFDKNEIERVLRDKVIPKARLDELTSHQVPKAIVLAGQPGSGKGALVRAARQEFGGDILVVDPDEQRDRIPGVKTLQESDPFGWPEKTNKAAFRLANGLRDAGIDQRVNLVIDGSMSDADNSIRTIRSLQNKGYDIEVRTMSTHWLESELGIDRRFADQIDRDGVARNVDMDFHNRVYRDLPDNLRKVAEATGIPVRIYDRDLNELYDSRHDAISADTVLRETRSGRLDDSEIKRQLQEDWQRQQTWHQSMPDTVRGREDIPKPAAEALVAGHNERGMLERATGRVEILGAIDAPAQLPEAIEPRYSQLRGMSGATALGVAVAAYEWNGTHQRAQVFQQTLDNDSAALDTYVRQGAQTMGGAAGGLAGAGTAAALGVGSAGTFALVTADAYLFAAAAEKAVAWWENDRIHKQTDRDGVAWEFNGRQWIRDDLRADLVADGIDHPEKRGFSALPDKARELSYRASVEAVEQALGKVPEPRNPFVQSPNDGDAHSLRPRDWTYQAENGAWMREVVTALDHRELPSETKYVEASPERAAQLSAQAMRTIDDNLASGQAMIAARYQVGHKAHGYDHEGDQPAAIAKALDPDLLQASDGRHYRRDAQGEWAYNGEPASHNRALELELTRDRLQPALQQHQQSLAQMPEWKPHTPEQQDRANLAALYAGHGIAPTPERFEATYAAVQRTRETHDLGAATSSLALTRDASGGFSVDSPIQHLRRDDDGVVRVAAVTTADEVKRAQTATPIEKPIEPTRGDIAPLPPRDGAALRLDNSAHPNHTMFATLLDTVQTRDRALGRDSDEVSLQLAGGLTAQARARGLDAIGFAGFTPDGTKVAMTNTTDPAAPWARTAVGQVGDLVGQPLAKSSEQVATLNQQLALTQPAPSQAMQQEETVARAMRMA